MNNFGAGARPAARGISHPAGWLVLVSLVVPATAFAAGGRAPPADSAWREECGSCHIAYPPQLLPAASWRQLMATLDRHFDADASIAAERARGIEAFLVANARKPSAESTLRITETAWFRREHDEVTGEFRSAAVRSAANCGACHPRAEQGRFSERDIRMPGGNKR